MIYFKNEDYKKFGNSYVFVKELLDKLFGSRNKKRKKTTSVSQDVTSEFKQD